MILNNDLILQSNNDIPFPECAISIHQPTISEISLIGEENFQSGIRFLNFSKDLLGEEDKNNLSNQSDFDIFMSIMCSKESATYKNAILMVFTLLFPDYSIKMKQEGIELHKDNDFTTLIDESKYNIFKDIINSMFMIKDEQVRGKYNPADARAAKIAEKFAKKQQKMAKQQGQDLSKVSLYSRYVSILSVGLSKDKNELMEYTVSQLSDEFERYQLKQAFDIYMEAKMAGAKDLDEVDNWMKELHS